MITVAKVKAAVHLETYGSERDWQQVLYAYGAAAERLERRITQLAQEYEKKYAYNPVEHIKYRVKSVDKICQKLVRRGYDPSPENAIKHISDIGGVRVVCSFLDDIYMLADNIMLWEGVSVIAVKDYIKMPKPNGYRSLHLLLKVPASVRSTGPRVIIEVQLRTVAMDFWASSEHRIFYKSNRNIPADVFNELHECAAIAEALDDKMQSIRRLAGSLELFASQDNE